MNNTRRSIMAAVGLSLVSGASFAAPDEAQRQMILKAMQAKEKLRQAQAAQGAQRQSMMADHMKMMQMLMPQMMAAKPAATMSSAEHDEWMVQHKKLMSDMMEQMMAEQHMMMSGPSAHCASN